jgi:hypothetical protein
MKIDCGETYREKIERLEKWHDWFAWRPVRVGSHDCRWLEVIQRKIYWKGSGMWGDPCVEYRAKSLDNNNEL